MENNLVEAKSLKMHLTTGKDNSLAISHFKEPKINEVSLEEIKPLINRILVLLGIKGENIPGKEEKFLIVSFLLDNYSNLTLFEIQKAFELAITGKLKVKAAAYQNFNCEYLASILNAYKQHIQENKIYVNYLEEPKEDLQENGELIKKAHETFLLKKWNELNSLLEEKEKEVLKGGKISISFSLLEIDSLISCILKNSNYEVSPQQKEYISKLSEGGATKSAIRRHKKILTLEVLFCNILKDRISRNPNDFFIFTKKYYDY